MRQVREFNRTEVPANPQLLKRIPIKTLRGRGNYGAMHHKVIYMASHYRREVVWGSFNFSNNAAKYNYENCSRISQPIGANNDQLTQVLDDFWGHIKSQDLSYKESTHKDILKTPLLMHFCEDLTLRNMSCKKVCLKLLQQSAVYFTHMKTLKIYFDQQLAEDSEIIKLLKKIAKGGIEVDYFF